MENISRTEIIKRCEIHQSTLSNILTGRRRPSWSIAKRLAAATDTEPVLWLEGSPNEIKKALSQPLDATCPPDTASALAFSRHKSVCASVLTCACLR